MTETSLKNIINGLMNNEIDQPTFEKQSNGELKYKLSDGSYVTDQVYINGVPYLFANDGSLRTGWQTVFGKRYYYDPENGHIKLGLINYINSEYYVTFKDGKLINRKLETIVGSSGTRIVNINNEGVISDYDFDALINKVNDLETRVRALESKS